MINMKKWMTKMAHVPTLSATITGGTLVRAEILSGFSGLYIIQIQVTISSQIDPGQNLFTARISLDNVSASGFGVSFNGRNPIIALLNGGALTVRNASSNSFTSGTTHTVNIVAGADIPVRGGGVKGYLLHLNESLKSFVGRRWARYAESQENADEAVRTGELSRSHNGSVLCYHGEQRFYGMDYSSDAINGKYNWNSRVLYQRDVQYWYERLLFANATNNSTDCGKEYNVRRGSNYSADYVSCSGLTTIPGEGVMAC